MRTPIFCPMCSDDAHKYANERANTATVYLLIEYGQDWSEVREVRTDMEFVEIPRHCYVDEWVVGEWPEKSTWLWRGIAEGWERIVSE